MHNVSDAREIEILTTEPLVVPGLNFFEVEIVLAKLRKYKLPSNDQILAKVIQAGGETLLPAMHKIKNFVWNKKKLPNSGRSLFLYQFTKAVIKLIVIIIIVYHCCELHTQFC
jgi:hypothetical protein